jgi:hypothetical protein
MEHRDGRGLIARAGRQEPPKLLLPLILGGGLLGGLKTLRPTLGGDGGGEIGKLLGLKRKDLIAGLGCLERAGGRLAGRHERRHLCAVGVEIADDALFGPVANVEAEHLHTGVRRHTNTCYFTMVALDANRKPAAVPPLVLDTDD